jgi:gliding motility-associated-like protein
LWSTGETTQSITVTQSGDYWVQVCDSTFGEVLVYENDFDSFIGSEWSDNTTSTYNGTTVLGNFNNSSTTLSLSNLPAHNSIKAVFDLYLLDSWDGNSGPDIWDLSIDGGSTINTTFANINSGGGQQSYPGNYPSSNAPLSGASQTGLSNICFNGVNSISSLYKINSPFSTHYASSANIDFSANGLGAVCDEYWAIDSVRIYLDSALSCCATEFVHVEFIVLNANLVSGIKDDISCFGADDGSVNIDISALLYPVVSTEWTGPNNFLSNLEDINNLSPGIYSVLITDVNNCFITQDFEIKEPNPILPNPLITNVGCYGGSDGSVSLSITGGATPYSVDWGTANPLNLYTGTYTFTIIDGDSCMFVGEVIISEPDSIVPNPITTSVICHGDSSGTAILFPAGGTPPYNISWGASNPSLLPFGTHLYTITDSKNCSTSNVVNIMQPDPLFATPYTQDVSCYGDDDGSCTLSIIGGSTPYYVSWNGADSTSLSAGIYAYNIIDSNNCILSDSITISQPDSLIITYTTTDVQCYGEPTGAIDVSVLSVNPPYSFNWSNPNNPTYIAITEDINNLYAGTYLVTVTDNDNCEAELQIIVNQSNVVSQYLDIQTSNYTGYHIACKGDNSGWISVNVNGGHTPFNYLWSNAETSDSIYNLFSGIYTLIITDGLGCLETIQLNLLEPTTNLTGSIQATTDYNGFNISCYSGNDGAIREIPIGGVPPYAWYWDGISGGEYLINQIAGYHHVELYDNNNCFWENNIILTEPPPLDVQKISVTDTCSREVGEAYAYVSGGMQDYKYFWSTGDTLSVATNLAEGNHELIITDANNCTDTAWYSIGNLPSPLIDFYIFPDHKNLFEQLDDPFVFIDNTQAFWQNVEYWYWNFGDNNFEIDSIALHSYHDTGMYDVSLIIVTEYNCVDTIIKRVLVDDYTVYIPNAFTPDNDDETNNIFYVYGYGINRFLMKIYSRWGELLFESEDMKKGWDGRKKGHAEICPSGIYGYYVEVENIYGEIYKFEGQVFLAR